MVQEWFKGQPVSVSPQKKKVQQVCEFWGPKRRPQSGKESKNPVHDIDTPQSKSCLDFNSRGSLQLLLSRKSNLK